VSNLPTLIGVAWRHAAFEELGLAAEGSYPGRNPLASRRHHRQPIGPALLEIPLDVGIGPAGDVWGTNNWQYYPAALGKVDEAPSTAGWRPGRGDILRHGQPVRTPLIGPPRAPWRAGGPKDQGPESTQPRGLRP
jgi:hypothetical protein